ncbi:Uncharacterized protein Fot_07352 [Forsythia ovata]|uniref:Uncharacterized protein n=1 Tax=Forsythia ovata TaxID=205694 RepID=A0ABD1WYH0_9LAMI
MFRRRRPSRPSFLRLKRHRVAPRLAANNVAALPHGLMRITKFKSSIPAWLTQGTVCVIFSSSMKTIHRTIYRRLVVNREYQPRSICPQERPETDYSGMYSRNAFPVAIWGSRGGRKADHLEKIVDVVLNAAKQSLKKKGMPFPPWCKADYVKAKWLSPYT